MKIIRNITCMLALFIASATNAQQQDVVIQNVDVQRVDDSVFVSFFTVVPPKMAKSSYCVTISPQLIDTVSMRNVQLKPIMTIGRKWKRQFKQQQRLTSRSNRVTLPATYNYDTEIYYSDTIRYESWMKEVAFSLNLEEEGCCRVNDLGNRNLGVYDLDPEIGRAHV